MTNKDYTLLVVDDSAIIRDILCFQIDELGYQVDAAEHGAIALEMMRQQQYDLVLSDIMMPEMDGYQMLETLKNTDEFRHIPVIMITDVNEIESIARCIELGAEDYLPKNYNEVVLKARIEACLEKKRLRDVEIAYTQKLEEDFIAEKKEKERMLQELEIARKIQDSLLPEKTPTISGLEIGAITFPAKEVGGDFYDFIQVDPDNTGFVIADVSGKGVPAAIFMSLSRAIIRANAVRNPNGAEAIVHANKLIEEDSKTCMFVTVFYGIFETAAKQFRYVNAGHNPPLFFRAESAGFESLKTAGGMALGIIPEIELTENRVALQSGDLIVMYTDGITEAFNDKSEEFGEERLMEVIRTNHQLSAPDLVKSIIDAVVSFAAGEPQTDDITLIVLKMT
ncbi:SpoIIE family protein phosphatase [bacterium]|nr:SpoIIE family protein phosphatase [bacterium]